jgi:flagellar protein FlaG
MEINNQIKTLNLEASVAKVTPAAENKVQVQVQQTQLEASVAKVTSVAENKEPVQVQVQQIQVAVPSSPTEEQNQGASGPEASLETAVSNINDYVQNLQRSLQFTVDEASGKDIVTVLDTETEEVIRQFPSEEVLEIARRLNEERDKAISLFNSQA